MMFLQNTIIRSRIKKSSELFYEKKIILLITYLIIGIKNTCNLLSVGSYWDVYEDIVGGIGEGIKIRIIDPVYVR